MNTPASTRDANAGPPASPSSEDVDRAGQDADGSAPRKPDTAVDEAARVLRGGPGEPHAGARPGQPDQASRQGFDRQRGEPRDQPPADLRDDANIAGDKDFELQPPK